MRTLSVTWKDLQVVARDRGSLFTLFLLPLIFILVLSVAAGAAVGGEEETGLPLTVVDGDPGGAVSAEILDTLERSGAVTITYAEAAEAEDELNEGTIRYALLVPEGFSADFEAGRKVELMLALHPLHDELRVMTVQRAVVGAARDYLTMEYLDRALAQMAEMQAAAPEDGTVFSEERIRQRVETQRAEAAERPLITVVETEAVARDEADTEEVPTYGQYTVVGMAVLFVFLAAQTTALGLFRERQQGTLRRLLAAPLGRSRLLGGKLLSNLILCLVQIVVIFVTGGLLVRAVGVAPLDLSNDPLGLVVVSLATALCSVSLGIFIAAFAKSEGQVGGITSVALFMAALLAGSFIPLFLYPPFMEALARAMPHYWANQAYYSLIFRGETLTDVLGEAGVLLAFAVGFFAVGVSRFRMG